jgi:hypothetical protein
MSHPIPITTAGLLAAIGLVAGCGGDGATGPSETTQFSQVLSLPQFDSTLSSGPHRIEINLLPGGLTVREVDVEPDDAEEKIVSAVTAIDPAQGTVTLLLGGFKVSYGANTRFRTPSKSRVSRGEWETAITAALNAGQQPPIEARRNQPAAPQAPTDASFLAADLRIADRTDDPKIEALVADANLEIVASPPPVAILRVFGLPLEITSQTHLGRRTPGGVPTGSVEFQASVTSVDVAGGAMTLAGGTVIRVGGTTFDPTGDLFSLQATADAVAAGKAVRAEGRGTVQSAGPPATITATEVKVEVDD